MRKSYVIVVIVSIGLFALGAVFAGTSILNYLNFPAFVVVMLPPLLFSFAAFGLSTFGRSFAVAFSGVVASKQELEIAKRLFGTLQKHFILTGLITTMIGLIAILANIEGADSIGGGLSVALITLFYSLVFVLAVTVPFKAAVGKRLVEIESS